LNSPSYYDYEDWYRAVIHLEDGTQVVYEILDVKRRSEGKLLEYKRDFLKIFSES
jgi:hypothetical protein